ncbi:MAG: hydantoinase B/oxoprolinase family protein, partial [SAR324 cluster bacterium]|nr:hydantoinase B/oxoprolinase family protein [SAR324 cluster bacterium]
FAPKGVVGGKDALPNRFYYEQTDGFKEPPMVSKMTGIHIKKGQKLRLETPGGGGYGNPEMRPEAAILKDRELGYITDQKQEF